MNLTGLTRVYAVLGRPVTHSLSPALYNRLFQDHHIDAVYVALDVAPEASDLLGPTLRSFGFAGVNLTVPHKSAVLGHLDSATEAVRASGAANVVLCEGGRLAGHNTDGTGFCDAYERRFGTLSGATVLLLGSGGAARAIAHEALLRGAHAVTFLNRSEGNAAAAVARLSEYHPGASIRFDSLDGAGFLRHASSSVVVHALPAGGRDRVQSLPIEALAPGVRWVDLNYWDPEPPAFAACERRGIATWRGLDMLAFQGAHAFALFTGIRVDPVRVAEHLG